MKFSSSEFYVAKENSKGNPCVSATNIEWQIPVIIPCGWGNGVSGDYGAQGAAPPWIFSTV